MVRGALILALGLAAVAGRAGADPACDEITASLDADASRARVWNLAWAITFGAAAIGSAVGALALPDDSISDNTRAGMWISAGKAAIGAGARVVLPMRIQRVTSCADADRALKVSARRERNGFILNTVGGAALNTAGLLYLGLERDAWKTGVISFVAGTVVGLISSYTAPSRAWRGKRLGVVVGDAGVRVVPTGRGLAIVGSW